jgi:hypothetical protein
VTNLNIISKKKFLRKKNNIKEIKNIKSYFIIKWYVAIFAILNDFRGCKELWKLKIILNTFLSYMDHHLSSGLNISKCQKLDLFDVENIKFFIGFVFMVNSIEWIESGHIICVI